MIEISHSHTRDSPDGQPWPPSDSDARWVMVRRADGHTLWRTIQLAQSDRLPRTLTIPRLAATPNERHSHEKK
jgi:hypothetical protein